MKKQLGPKFLLLAGLVFSLHFPAEMAHPQVQQVQTPTVEISELEKTIHLLENPEEARKLAAQLKRILEARKVAAEPEKPLASEIDKGLMDLYELYETHEERLARMGERITGLLETVTLHYQQLLTYLSQEKNWRKLAFWGAEILLALAVGLIVWLFLHRFTRRLEKKWPREGDRTRLQKIGRALIAALIRTSPWIALYAVFFLFFLLFPGTWVVKAFALNGLLALTIYQGIKHLLASLLLPNLRPEGLIPLQDEISGYIFIWLRRILLLSLWVYLLYLGVSQGKFPRIMDAVVALYKVGLTAFAIVILAQRKEDIQRFLSRPLRSQDPRWLSSLKRMVNSLSGKLYLFVLLYAGFLAVFFLIASPDLYARVASSSAKSALVVLAGAGLWGLWSFLFARLFEVAEDTRQRYPALAEQVNRYVPYIGDAGHGAIVVFSFLVILDVWGINLYDFISQADWFKHLLRIPIILFLAFLAIHVAHFFIGKFATQARTRMLAATTVSPLEVEKRISTITNIFRRAVAVAVAVFAGIMILSELGFDIKPILAGAGILGLAVGFGAQNLVRDIISGLFYTFENRIRVGDVAIINGTGGLVEQVNLRTTVLRGLDGTLHVFPNGAINTLSNMTYEFSYYLFDIGVAYKEDADRVTAVLKEVGDQIMQEEAYKSAILEPLEILGVDKFDDSAVVIKARIKTLPIKQWWVGREMNRRIKKRFDELGIEIPFPHRSFYFGEASKPISVKLEGGQERKEEIKAWVREVLEEAKGKH